MAGGVALSPVADVVAIRHEDLKKLPPLVSHARFDYQRLASIPGEWIDRSPTSSCSHSPFAIVARTTNAQNTKYFAIDEVALVTTIICVLHKRRKESVAN